MKYIIITSTLLLIFLSSVCFLSKAQTGNFEPYEKRKEKALLNLSSFKKRDTARIEALINVLYSAIFLKERKDVAPYLAEAFTLSRKLEYKDGLAKCIVVFLEIINVGHQYQHFCF